MSKVKIGFVGVGSMGQCAHLYNYAAIPDCEVVAIAELRKELAKKVAARYGITKVYASQEEMLSKEKLDGIVAPMAYRWHGAILPSLFKSGIPILTEKPLARSVEAGEKIAAEAKKAKVKYLLGYHKRSDPATIFVKEEIARLKTSGELGALRYIRIIMPPGDWIAAGFNHMITTDEEIPAGVPEDPVPSGMDARTVKFYDAFVNYYIHQVNLMRYLMDEDYHVNYADPAGIVMVVHGDKTGAAGVLEMAPYWTTTDWQEEALICFETGYIKLQLPAPLVINRPGKVIIFRDPKPNTKPEFIEPQFPWVHAMRQQAINFVKEIRGEKTCLCGPEEALKDLKISMEYIDKMRGNMDKRFKTVIGG
ncbi:MAG: Gfo/Idh/MocA family oxidoreductase [Candidatus Omnitrophica bacterium]|nr:Gfo/Idh/MocA family oxidoreductase [Candidatus Omnitrophota bacterium]